MSDFSEEDFRLGMAEDYDLFALSNETKEWWYREPLGIIHETVLLIITEKLSFHKSDEVLNKIIASIGKKEITKTTFTISDNKLKEWGLSSDCCSLIRSVLELSSPTVKDIVKIRGIGIRNIKAIKIIMGEEDDQFLYEDLHIRRCMAILFNHKKPLTPSDAKHLSSVWEGHRSQISMFLLRLTFEGIGKIVEMKPLTKEDFMLKTSQGYPIEQIRTKNTDDNVSD